MDDRRPVVYFDDAFLFTLRVDRTEYEKDHMLLPSDDGTIRRFMEWMIDNDVSRYERGGGAGPDFYSGTFPPGEKKRILEWCAKEGLIDWEDIVFDTTD